MTDREFDTDAVFLDIPDVLNFRDASCGVLRPGVLYRSASLSGLSPEGARRLKPLGIRTVVDLRSPAEIAAAPDLFHGLDHDYLHAPLLPDRHDTEHPWPSDQFATYQLMAEIGGDAVAATVRRLAGDGAPLLVHCAVGKDRTGLTIAVIQHLAGLSDADITADYLRSNRGLGLDAGPVPYIDEHGVSHVSHPAEADRLHTALARIRELHGTIETYLTAHGVTPAELAAVRAALSTV
ncbi:tyrosine-protein phosphatase [Kitasatospora sp. NPDC048540]|uniref:tyrosine-protein phosphatase n=1 Tax=Kitasatospora sp. NPDC048540 TaxID=3155634 RepID=UPI0033E98D5E